jgi:hypothetical protein
MLKSKIAMRTWAEHDEATPGVVEVDLVVHEGGNAAGRFCFTLTVTDIATGWTENRTVPDKRQIHVVDPRGRGDQRGGDRDAVPDQGDRLRQRRGVHQRPAVPVLP